MRDPLQDVIARAKALPPDERQVVVDELLQSLNAPASEALDASWEAEIRRRLDAYDRGEVQAIDAVEVFAKARRLA
jgi:putative addiction module component (TIGR02574 family)